MIDYKFIIALAVQSSIFVAGLWKTTSIQAEKQKVANNRIVDLENIDKELVKKIDYVREQHLKCDYRASDFDNLKLNNMRVIESMQKTIDDFQPKMVKIEKMLVRLETLINERT
ncbi:MAG: hypothetical protein GY714_20985 [Desulfobacterales bacterium]|nr:hypothetical protein [Desulfobacterales bacterium]